MSNVEEFLEHYGVKGMRWGVRKKRPPTTKTQYDKSPSRLTDAELKRRVQRLETETRYNTLNQQEVSAGKKIAERILVGSGEVVVSALLVGTGKYLVKKGIEKKFGPDVAKAIIKK